MLCHFCFCYLFFAGVSFAIFIVFSEKEHHEREIQKVVNDEYLVELFIVGRRTKYRG